MAELHEGIYGSHIGGWSLASKAIRAGYYWPTIREDWTRYAQQCKQCQQHANCYKAPPEELMSIYSPRPFRTWAIDILGPFHLAIRQMKYLVVIIEYLKCKNLKQIQSSYHMLWAAESWNKRKSWSKNHTFKQLRLKVEMDEEEEGAFEKKRMTEERVQWWNNEEARGFERV